MTQTPIKTVPVPASILPKSIATPTLLTQIISAKHPFGLPLYRQEALFKNRAASTNHESRAV